MGAHEYFEHTADVGMRVWADSFEELLAEAGRGLANLIVPDSSCINIEEHRTIELAGDEPELLLFDLLAEMTFLSETQGLVFREIQVTSNGPNQVRVQLGGEKFDPDRHPTGNEVKAVTYHGLFAEKKDGRWLAEVIFDI